MLKDKNKHTNNNKKQPKETRQGSEPYSNKDKDIGIIGQRI